MSQLLLKIRFYKLLNGVFEAKNDENFLYISSEKYDVLLNEAKTDSKIYCATQDAIINACTNK